MVGCNGVCRLSGRSPRALVLAPTRELAKQVEREFMESAPMLSTVCVYGGVPISTQQRQLQRGIDIAVGTPGRIIDLIDRRSLHLQDVSFLVLDEADQMLAVGFEEDVERILEQIPQARQSMLFSATMPSWVKKLSRKYLKDPLTIDLVWPSPLQSIIIWPCHFLMPADRNAGTYLQIGHLGLEEVSYFPTLEHILGP